MKNLSFTRLVLVALLILSGLKIFATEPDFQVNGIYYKITSIEERECSVYGPVYPENNPTKLIIPTEVTYNGASFTVVSVFGEDQIRTKRSRYVNVKELILPNSVKVIEFSAFYNVQSLERVQMDGVKYISSNAFENCVNLKSISMKKVEFIGFAGFSDCRSFEKIIIPPSCKKIEKSAFLGCVNPRLTVVIEDSDEPLLCNSTFGSGRKIYIGRNIQGWYGLGDAARHTYHNDIYYFKEIEFGDKVTEMLGINLTRRNYDDLENFPFKITIGASIREVPDFANDDMTIQSLYLVSAVPPRVKGAFSNRTYLHGTLYVPKGSLAAYKDAPIWKNFLNIQEYETDRTIAANKEYFAKKQAKEAAEKAAAEKAAKEAEEAKRKAEEEAKRKAEALEAAERYAREVEAAIIAREHPVIPDGTTEIAAHTYKGKPIKSITIPNSVTRIGDGAFEGCTNLTSVTIPNSVTSIGDGAFGGCTGLTSPIYNAHVFAYMPPTYSGAYTIPDGIEQIAGKAFAGCNKLTSITIPNSVTNIGNRAFNGCFEITSITIPNSVTNIGNRAFNGCFKITSITIPRGVTRIGDETFNTCFSLTSIEIPDNIIGIGARAFGWCSHLTSIYIPNSVTSIGEDAFIGCKNLNISLPKKWKGKINLSDCKKVKYYK